MKMTKKEITNKVIKNYTNIYGEFKNSSIIDELKNTIKEFSSIENLFNLDKFDEFCKNQAEHPTHNWIYFTPLNLFYGYMFKYHMNTTIENWPNSHDELVDTLHNWNYSTDILY